MKSIDAQAEIHAGWPGLRLRRTPAARKGFVVIAVVVVFALSTALFGVWANAAIRAHRQLANLQLRSQAVRLAEAGVRRAIVRRRADPRYDDEVWSVPAAELGRNQSAEVRIRVTAADNGGSLHVEATALFPLGTPRRAKITKHVEISNPNGGNES
jgi:type II secretory pathway component PulK